MIASLTFIVLLASGGARSASTILLLPIEHAFGWSLATVSTAIAVNLVLFGMAGPFAAALMERYGVRPTVLVALILVAIGVGLTVWMTAAWHFILTETSTRLPVAGRLWWPIGTASPYRWRLGYYSARS